MRDKVVQAARFMAKGKPILLFDFPNREAETDLIFHGLHVTHREITMLRTRAGAPVTAYLPFEFGKALNLPRMTEVFSSVREKYPLLSMIADNRRKHDPLFSFTLDARVNRTGCSSVETAVTVQRLAYFVQNYQSFSPEELKSMFVAEFKTPGHLPVIICSNGLLKSRIGHAEMVLSIAEAAELPKIAVASEMINLKTGKPLKYDEALSFAEENNLVFLEGKDVLNHFGITA